VDPDGRAGDAAGARATVYDSVGSRARGRAGRDSDIDLLIVKDDPRRPVERIRDVLARLYRPDRRHLWRTMPPFEALVLTPEEFRERLALGDPFFRSILAEGRTLMERGRDAA
jgi:predicted nucleotidyltransferase